VAHPSTKQILKDLIDDLPENATIADVQYRLYIIDAVNRGRDEIASGAGIPHEQVANAMRAKWGRGQEK
jgi:predicted transcriptional regulator